MDKNKSAVTLSKIDRLRLRLNYFSFVAVVAAIIVIGFFPADDALITFPIIPFTVALILLIHIYAIRSGSQNLARRVENFIFASGLIMWALVWFNGEPATILQPAYIAFAGVFGFARFWFLVWYSIGSLVVMLAALFLHDLDPAVVGRSFVTLIAIIGLLFFLRGYIKLLDSTNKELELLQNTFTGVLQAAKIDVFDERVSDGSGKFLHAHHSPDAEFVGGEQRLAQVEPEFRDQLSANLQRSGVPTEFRFKFDPLAGDEGYRWYRQQSVYEYMDDQGELHRVGFSQMIEHEIKSRDELTQALRLQRNQAAKLKEALNQLEQNQRSLETEVSKFDSLCNQLDMIYWHLDLKSGMLTYNAHFARRWGFEIGGTVDFELFKSGLHPDYTDFHQHAIDQVLLTKETVRTRYQSPVPEREGRWFELIYWPTFAKDGEILAVSVANFDVTELIAIEDELRRSNAELARQQVREQGMYAVIGHEMRTPAAILKMQLEQERKGLGTIDRNLFEASVDQLLTVVDTLRTVSKPDEIAEHERSRELVSELVSNQVAILQTLAKDAGIKLSAEYYCLSDKPVMLMAGPLKQLISNLIKNAILHSGASEVRLTASSELISDSVKRLRLDVDDDGCGISESERDRLFEAYERGEGTSSGTGLGLYICREIAKMMDGDLRYEPSPLGGARFVLEWSAEVAVDTVDENSEIDSQLSNSLAGLSVLLVEDDAGILQMTAVLLSSECSVLRIAKNGQQALDILAKSQVDLVLTDIFMPEMNGIEFSRAAREQGYNQPIIGLTAATLGHETESLLEAGADAVMNKPVRIDELKSRVSMLLATAASSDQ